MQTTEVLLGLLRERGRRGLPLTRVYRQLYNTNLYLSAYGRIYSIRKTNWWWISCPIHHVSLPSA